MCMDDVMTFRPGCGVYSRAAFIRGNTVTCELLLHLRPPCMVSDLGHKCGNFPASFSVV